MPPRRRVWLLTSPCLAAAAVPAWERVSTDLHLPGTTGFRRLNLAMVLAGLAAFGILYATQPVLPRIGATYDVGPSRASLTVSATTGALALAVLPMAALAVRIGRVRAMRGGLLLAVAADRTRRGGADVPGAGRAAGGDRRGAGRGGGRRDGARRRGGGAAWPRLRDGPLRGRQLPGRGRRPGPLLAGRRQHLVALGCGRGRGRGTARDRGVLVAAARARGRPRARGAGRRRRRVRGPAPSARPCWRCCSCRSR